MSTTATVLQSQLPAYGRVRTEYEKELLETARILAAPGKGILAADEPNSAYDARFAPMGLENTVENRRHYRVILLETEDLNKYVGGVILSKETVEQNCSSGVMFTEMLRKNGIVSGVNVDGGLHPFHEGAPGEEITAGMDGYVERAQHYYRLGCRFCKWRNVFKIQNGNVSEALIQFNAETQARYAALSQLCGLVPIVEPEVMLEGTHDLETCQRVSEHVWATVFAALHRHGVILEGMFLKPSMVVAGSESGITCTPAEVALATVQTLSRVVPPAVPAIGFLSGGLSELQSSEYLNAINNAPVPRPWHMTFTFGRALQGSALAAWKGKDELIPEARRAFLHRAKMNSLAASGKYDAALEASA
ncbi:Fructose-bisphosphate aldolase class-I [Novymonas esmeraldas]|uniref:fructose-bisphosphate aldolase n=1 Tax=Novymonas esmeraldas TaxID=1808958 RepID=A0AAW0EYN7_9TRYP